MKPRRFTGLELGQDGPSDLQLVASQLNQKSGSTPPPLPGLHCRRTSLLNHDGSVERTGGDASDHVNQALLPSS
jgi:hypothetical protein